LNSEYKKIRKKRKNKSANLKHDRRMNIRVTDDEYETIRNNAINARTSISNFVRKASCGYKFKQTPPKEFYESIKTLRELSFKLDDMVKAKINFKYYDADKIENTLVHLIADIKEKYL